MNNLSSYCRLVDAKIRASDKDFPVKVNNLFKFQAQDSDLEYLFRRFEIRIAHYPYMYEELNTPPYVIEIF